MEDCEMILGEPLDPSPGPAKALAVTRRHYDRHIGHFRREAS